MKLLTTKEAAKLLEVNEKMVYSLVSDKGLPATKITGKWLFPKHLIEGWVELNTVNYPQQRELPLDPGLLLIVGSNDPLLEKTINLFNIKFRDHLALFGNVGSMGGLNALFQNRCHMAASHLLEKKGQDYNFEFFSSMGNRKPALINFCKREQGIIVQKGNPKKVTSYEDFKNKNLKIVNRPLGTGTRHLLDKELESKGIKSESIRGYQTVVSSHLEAGITVLLKQADAAPCIRSIAQTLNLDFITTRWERYDLLVTKENFFNKAVQNFKELLYDDDFKALSSQMCGYDLSQCGKMIFPKESPQSS